MRAVPRWSLLLSLLVLAAPVLALPDLAPDELEHNRLLLARWKQDPAHYARLKRDLHWLQALPPERREALRQLDHDLHQEDPTVQARLWRVMDRYASWLEHLPATDLQQVDAAATSSERLRKIKEIREREWIERLPRARREQLASAAPEERAELLAKLRQQERDRRLEWQQAIRSSDEPSLRRNPPLRVADLPPEVQFYVNNFLWPQLDFEEKRRLRAAEGQAPRFSQTLAELAQQHPASLPGPATGPMHIKDLPGKVKQRVQQLKGVDKSRLRLHEGTWPDYAIEVTKMLRERTGGMPQELGPCRPTDREFTPAMRQFIEEKLVPALTEREKERLHGAEGRWPDYPRTIVELARRHGLEIPDLPPPGPRAFWERLQAATP